MLLLLLRPHSSYARNLFIPSSVFGIGDPHSLKSLHQALDLVSGGRNKLVFVNNGFTNGDIQRVIDQVAAPARASGKQVEVLTQEEELSTLCRNSLRGTSSCIAAAVFHSSPTEGNAARWNYTIRADGALAPKIIASSDVNDPEVYVLPLQHAIDFAIAGLSETVDLNALPTEVLEFPYTSLTQKEREDAIRTRYMTGIINILAVAFYIGMVGVTYQLTGLVASEREIGMAQLLDCMMPNEARWQPQAARIIANIMSFNLLYAPGWIIMAIILSIGVFSRTAKSILIVFHILSGFSMSSMSTFGASFFHKAQLSGITLVIVSLILGIIAQVNVNASTGAVAVLSLIFPPMNYVYFIVFMARWEKQNLGTSLVHAAPENPSRLPGIANWLFFIIQILVFPVLGAIVERSLYGTASKSRVTTHDAESKSAVVLKSFSKVYKPSWIATNVGPLFGLHKQDVLAVSNLSLTALKGQVMVLLGANGSGKSTTLDAMAGLAQISSGHIELNYPQHGGGFGLCPQKNVLWDDLTVFEHIKIFNRIKCFGQGSSNDELRDLLCACDILQKDKARSKTLSGGQKRKVQLAMMFTGGSNVCCVDEMSSGLDPISRRKIWDILLVERGARSIILTTHFLDEADLLSDQIAILSKGTLRAEGTAVELKHRLGSGYRVHVYKLPDGQPLPEYQGVLREIHYDKVTYTLEDSAKAADFLARLENDGVREYQVSGPTIEDVFLKVAEEVEGNHQVVDQIKLPQSQASELPLKDQRADAEYNAAPQLVTGKRIGFSKQAWVLFGKRATVLRRNYLPYIAALLIPIAAAGLVTLFLKGFQKAGCAPAASDDISQISNLASQTRLDMVVGPPSRLPPSALQRWAESLSRGGSSPAGDGNSTNLLVQSLHLVDTLDEFHKYIRAEYANVTPGGFFLGDASSSAIFAWRGDVGGSGGSGDMSYGMIIQNALDTLLTNVSIGNQYQAFNAPWGASVGDALQLVTYFGLAMSVYPAFFALYPTLERLRNVRALHYSNGVRSLPLWLAYVSFDFLIVIAVSVVATVIFRAVANVWYHIEYLFVVFCLYGLASTLLSYVISFCSRSQLASFAFAAAGQAVIFLLYFVAYMSVLTYSPTNKIQSHANIAHFTIALISPISNLTRSLLVSLNIFSITCRDRELLGYPGAITAYGGPILYLIGQAFFLFGLLLWWDSGPLLRRVREAVTSRDPEKSNTIEGEVSDELTRVMSSQDGLRVLHLSKQFKKNLAVDDVTFGVPRGEVFALLGPNGAGKSTVISLIRGDIQPSQRGGEVLVENVSISKHRAEARSHLGVCPQFDAMDTMTVTEHLAFYARVRGVPNAKNNVKVVMRAVGLQPYADRMAAKLSGGNKRKLSLGIALMGNPTVLLLDEPSSGMDAAIKRVMWRTLASVVPGRSLVLTTHSMEEADALANRAGIMAGKMLALGTTDYLRRKHGGEYHVHLVHSQAPHTSDADMEKIRAWVLESFPAAIVEDKTYHGQLRFSVPSNLSQAGSATTPLDGIASSSCGRGISALFKLLEQHKRELGFEYYSVSQTTLDQVFLSIVGKHNVEEEGERRADQRTKGSAAESVVRVVPKS